MDDVKRLFLDDAKEKKITGYSAHKKAYTSRRVRFPSDYLTDKAFGALNYALGTLEYLKLCDMPSYAGGALSRVVSDIRDFVDNAEVYV